MRTNYDFSRGKKNPYARKLKKQVTIRLDEAVLDYFKQLAHTAEMPWQSLVNLYLRDCAQARRALHLQWRAVKTTDKKAGGGW